MLQQAGAKWKQEIGITALLHAAFHMESSTLKARALLVIFMLCVMFQNLRDFVLWIPCFVI